MSASIADRIRNARAKRGLTQAQLAKRLGLTPQAISEWEHDGNKPRRELVEKVAAELGLKVTDLL